MNIVKGAKVAILIILYTEIMNFLLDFLSLNQPQNFMEPNPTTLMIFLPIIFFMFHTNNSTIRERSDPSSPFDELSSCIISEISPIPFLDPTQENLSHMIPTISAPHDHHVEENILIEGSDIHVEKAGESSPPLLLLDYKNNTDPAYEAARIDQQEKYPVENELTVRDIDDGFGYSNGDNGLSPSHYRQKYITLYDHGYMSGAEMDEYSRYDACQCGYEGDSEDNGHPKHGDLNKTIEEFIAANKRVWKDDLIKEKSIFYESCQAI
ncbi:hypothetical protein F511_31630 [Dorcoceras hygrometricum]|uniref:Uncharacterized protein n=1 Tax=Dorcoceras hygrometricum TaxID=472368 RepID=A0A2Z7AQZ1_9LAMI|nr:hypothetical protein F511_31630 [Dorcoceras hygrometricum]